MEIRFGVEADYISIEKIANQAQHYHVKLRPDIYLESIESNNVLSEDQYKNLVLNNNMIVCTSNSIIVAYMAFEDKLNNNPLMKKQKILFINKLAVDDTYKQKGISKLLMSWIKNYARENQYEKIELQVNDRNDLAKQLYYNQGFVNKSVNMEYFV